MAVKFPWLIARLFRLRFPRSHEFALGDLMEECHAGTRSRVWLLRQALSLSLPGTVRPWPAYPQRENNMTFLTSLWHDLRYAARTLRNNPGFTAVAVLAIALGVGVNTGIFTDIERSGIASSAGAGRL